MLSLSRMNGRRPGRAGARIGVVTGLLAFITALVAACGARQPPLTPEQERGSLLYGQYCIQCHGGARGGKIKDIPPPHNANGHTWHHPDQQLIDIALNGLDFSVEGQQKMPPFKGTLTDDDIRAILAYIKTWWTPEQRSYQATVTANSAQPR